LCTAEMELGEALLMRCVAPNLIEAKALPEALGA
jgi:hypothetical protein